MRHVHVLQATWIAALFLLSTACVVGDAGDAADPTELGPVVGHQAFSWNGDRLMADDALYPGQYISNGQVQLVYQGDGNLVLYSSDWQPLWASWTQGTSPNVAIMQGDGNFVVYDAGWNAVWASWTHGYPGAYLYVSGQRFYIQRSDCTTYCWPLGIYPI
jgi:hypothetical protein